MQRVGLVGLWISALLVSAIVLHPDESALPPVGEPVEIEGLVVPTDPMGWEALAGLQGIALWARLQGLSPATASEAVVRARLARAQAFHDPIAKSLGLDSLTVAVLLDGEAREAIDAACPAPVVPALGHLCDARVRERIEGDLVTALIARLDVADPMEQLWLIEMAIELGPAGQAIAAAAEPEVAVLIESRILQPIEFYQKFQSDLQRDEPIALVVAMELGRLGHGPAAPEIEMLSSRLTGTAEELIVRYAHALATSTINDPAWWVPAGP